MQAVQALVQAVQALVQLALVRRVGWAAFQQRAPVEYWPAANLLAAGRWAGTCWCSPALLVRQAPRVRVFPGLLVPAPVGVLVRWLLEPFPPGACRQAQPSIGQSQRVLQVARRLELESLQQAVLAPVAFLFRLPPQALVPQAAVLLVEWAEFPQQVPLGWVQRQQVQRQQVLAVWVRAALVLVAPRAVRLVRRFLLREPVGECRASLAALVQRVRPERAPAVQQVALRLQWARPVVAALRQRPAVAELQAEQEQPAAREQVAVPGREVESAPAAESQRVAGSARVAEWGLRRAVRGPAVLIPVVAVEVRWGCRRQVGV